ncbi:MAG: bifunctional metallophosphatase/5-nucleotidase [Burkholderiales bacterium]|jgi:2',3'-cyclic-nucleotide 2'-phosphodiesterase/3'-nucleotidase|nr:bifunctional metallophosphatase/5-nucleotidase [Burkholderiales bacterium]
MLISVFVKFKKSFTICFITICLGLSLVGCSSSTNNNSATSSLSILYINDLHGQLEEAYNDVADPSKGFKYPGIARVAAWVKKYRETHPNTLFLAGGDNYQGTMGSNYYYGDSVSDFFNIMGITYSALGNHEFDFGYEVGKNNFIYNPINKGTHFIAANIAANDDKGSAVDFVEPYQILKTNIGLRPINVVIIGLATTETPVSTAGAQGLKFTDPAQSAASALDQAEITLQKDNLKPDIVLFLTHIPSYQKSDPYIPNPKDPVVWLPNKFLVPEDSEIHELTQWIASRNEIKNISVVLSAHSHMMVNGHVAGNLIPVVQAGYNGRAIAVVDINCPYNQSAACSLTPNVVDLTKVAGDYTPDPEVTALIDKYLNNSTYKQMATREITNSCSIVPNFPPAYNNFNFKLPYLLANQLRHVGQTTIGVFNLGGLRADLPKGEINYSQLYNIMPFETYNLVETGKIPGWAIRQVVDNTLHLGTHLQIATAGIAFYATPLSPNQHYTGPIYLTRMGTSYKDPTDGSILYNDDNTPVLLDDNTMYTITSVNFLLDADPKYPGDGFDFTMVANKQYLFDSQHQTNLTIRQMLENELVRDKTGGGCQEYTPYNWINAIQPGT